MEDFIDQWMFVKTKECQEEMCVSDTQTACLRCYTSLPGDLGRVEVKTNKSADFLGREGCRVSFIDAKTLESERDREEMVGCYFYISLMKINKYHTVLSATHPRVYIYKNNTEFT